MKDSDELYTDFLFKLKEMEIREKLQKGLRPGETYKCERCNRPISFDEVTFRDEDYSSVHYHGFYNTLSFHNYSKKLCIHCYKHKKKVDKWFTSVFLIIYIIICLYFIIKAFNLTHDVFDGLGIIFISAPLVYGGYLVTKGIYTIIDDWLAKRK